MRLCEFREESDEGIGLFGELVGSESEDASCSDFQSSESESSHGSIVMYVCELSLSRSCVD